MAKSGTGYKTKAALKRESNGSTDFPTATAAQLGTNSLLPLREGESMITEKVVAAFNTLNGVSEESTHERTGLNFAGGVPLYGQYNNDSLMQLITCIMGLSDGTNSPQNLGAGAYDHYIELDNDLINEAFEPEQGSTSENKIRMFTLGIDKGGLADASDTNTQAGIWEFKSTKGQSLTIAGSVGDGKINIDTSVVAYDMTRESIVNQDSSGWTRRDLCSILFKDLSLRMRPVYEFTITSSNDSFRIIENAANNVDIDIPDGTYPGKRLAQLIARELTRGSLNSIVYSCDFNECTRKFTIKNTNNAVTFTTVVASSELHTTIGFESNPAVGLSITGQLGAIYDNADLDSNDVVAITDFTVNIDNPMLIDRNSSTGLLIDEQVLDGKRVITADITINKYKNNTFLNNFELDTPYIAELKFTGLGITDNHNYEFNMLMPYVKFTAGQATADSAGVINPAFTFMAFDPLNDIAPGWEVL